MSSSGTTGTVANAGPRQVLNILTPSRKEAVSRVMILSRSLAHTNHLIKTACMKLRHWGVADVDAASGVIEESYTCPERDCVNACKAGPSALYRFYNSAVGSSFESQTLCQAGQVLLCWGLEMNLTDERKLQVLALAMKDPGALSCIALDMSESLQPSATLKGEELSRTFTLIDQRFTGDILATTRARHLKDFRDIFSLRLVATPEGPKINAAYDNPEQTTLDSVMTGLISRAAWAQENARSFTVP